MTPNDLFIKHIDNHELTYAEEQDLIAEAQNGNDSAYEALLAQYAPLLKKQARAVPHHVETDDAQAALLLGVVEAVTEFNPAKHSRLASILPNHLRRALSDIGVTASHFTIPSRSLTRWLSILRKSDGNVYLAINQAPSYGMSREAFMDILSALRATDSLEAVLQGGEYVTRTIHVQTEAQVGESDLELVELAFETRGDTNDLTDREATVLRFAFGWFSYGDAMTDDCVGHHLGLSRATVQRTRQAALEKARRRLGLAA